MSKKSLVLFSAVLLVLPLAQLVTTSARCAESKCDASLEIRDGEFYDSQGRMVYLRGLNVAGRSKAPPFIPFEPGEVGPGGESWWDLFEEWGYNTVRFLVIWEAIEPEKGVYDTVYLDKVEALLEEAAQHGIYVFVDSHQDLFSRFPSGGDGAPRWAVTEAGVDPDSGGDWEGPWGLKYVFSAKVRQSFTSFWESRGEPDGLMEHYENALVEVAKRAGDNPYVLGYDIMNEPSCGSIGSAPEGTFENVHLKPFYESGIRAIREVDPDAMGFVEPHLFDMYWSSLTPFSPDLDHLVYAPHLYDNISELLGTMIPECLEYTLFDTCNRSQRNKAKELGMPMLVGEWGIGATINPPGSDRIMLNNFCKVYESSFTSNTYWCLERIARGDGEFHDLEVISRPHVRRLKGKPVKQSFNLDSREYVLEFKGGSKRIPTVIHVPESIQYPDGFNVTVSDGRFTYEEVTGELSYYCPTRPSRKHRLVITPELSLK